MDVSLEGKVALVTGASRGIGQAVAATMAASGAKVMLTSRKLDQLKEVQAGMDGEVDVIASHVGDADSGEKTVAATIERFGSLDILVNNAGILRDKSFAKMEMENFKLVTDVHLQGSANCTKAVWEIMRAQA